MTTSNEPDTRKAVNPDTTCDHGQAPPKAKFCPACGASLVTVNGRNARLVVPHQPMLTPRRLRWIAGTVAVVVLIATGTMWILFSRWSSPEQPIRELAAAITGADGPEVARILRASGAKPTAVDSPLLEPEALATGYEPPADFEIGAVSYKSDGKGQGKNREYASVTVIYKLANKTKKQHIDVSREDSGWFRQWKPSISDILTTIKVDAAYTKGVSHIANVAAYTDHKMVGLPGVYHASAGRDSIFKDAESTQSSPIGADTAITFDPKVRASAAADVKSQVTKLVDDCIDTGGIPEPHCGFDYKSPYHSTHVPKDEKWHLDSYPDIHMKLRDEYSTKRTKEDDSGPLAVETTTAGTATMEFINIIDKKTILHADIDINAQVEVDNDDSLTLTPTGCAIDDSGC